MQNVQEVKKSLTLDLKKLKFAIVMIVSILLVLVISNLNISNGVTFSNYTSERYQIQFQYPSTWQVQEKMNRFDEGVDLQIRDPSLNPFILIAYSDDLITGFGSRDLTTAVYDSFKDTVGDYSYDYDIVEQPSFNSTIDGHITGTWVYAWKDKYEDSALRWGTQQWIVFDGDRGYLIGFNGFADSFDSPENTQIRDQFVKSINFLGQSNATSSNMTNLGRFAE